MLKAIYTPLSGSLAQERVLEIIANNLANANTTGFKGDNVTFTLLEPEPEKHYKNPLPPANYKVDMQNFFPLRGNEIEYVGVAGIERDKTQGPVIQTGNPLDMMIEGKGFFTVNTTDGYRYTRDGAFSLNSEGVLVTHAGDPVLGEKGNIYLRSNQFQINSKGEIYQDGELVDKLLISNFDNDKALERASNNYYFYGGPKEGKKILKNAMVDQGCLEGSNVNAIKNLTAMIIAHRSFEAYQKAIKNYDTMMDKSSNSIGEIRA